MEDETLSDSVYRCDESTSRWARWRRRLMTVLMTTDLSFLGSATKRVARRTQYRALV